MLKRFFARRALRQRGICPDHIKLLNVHIPVPGKARWMRTMCEDCLPEYERQESEKFKSWVNLAKS